MSHTNRIPAMLLAVSFALLVNSPARAAVATISSLSISSASVTVSSLTFSTPLAYTLNNLPIYGGNLVNYSSGSNYVDLNSSATYGGNPISGQVDTSADTVNFDFSSLFLDANYTFTDSSGNTTNISVSGAPVWSNSSPISQDSYNPVSGAYTYEWSNTLNASVTYNGSTSIVPVSYDTTLQGNVTVVPLPATAPLMLGGLMLLGWYGLRRKRG